MCHWLTGEWVHCQLIHMELQSQSNSIDTEIVQDELKHSAPVLRGTHSKGIHKMFPWGLWEQGCCQQVSEGASGAYALKEKLVITLILMLMCLHRTALYLCTVLCFASSLFLYGCTYACVLLVCLFYTHPACVCCCA